MVLTEMREQVEEVKGFRSFFTQAKNAGLLIGVATSSERERALMVLDKVGVSTEVDVLVTAKDVTNGKPDPEMFLTTAAKLGVLPDECFVFEDSQSGITAAKSAGTTPILIMTTFGSNEIEGWQLAYKDFTEISFSEHFSH